MRLLVFFIILLLLTSFFSVFCEDLPDYEPYQDNEFPGWARSLRRGEVIFFGTIPFTFFLSNFSFGIYEFAASGFDSESAPAILGNKTPPVRTKRQKGQIIVITLSISGVLAVIDYLLGKPWNG